MRRTHLYAILSGSLYAISIAFAQGAPVQSGRFAMSAGLLMYVIPVLLYLWCKADTRTRSVMPPPGAVSLLAVLAPIGWIYYIFGTRRPLRALTTISAVIIIVLAIADGVHVFLIAHAAAAM